MQYLRKGKEDGISSLGESISLELIRRMLWRKLLRGDDYRTGCGRTLTNSRTLSCLDVIHACQILRKVIQLLHSPRVSPVEA